MSNNYIFKNLKEVLTGEEQVLLEHDGESIAFVICGGFVANISNENSPALAGTDDYIKYLKIVNTETDEETILYNNQIVGYLEHIEYNLNSEIIEAYFYLFNTDYYDEIIYNIKKSSVASLDKNPDIINLENNNLYQFNLIDDFLVLKKLKQ
jgi:hypothetical protein